MKSAHLSRSFATDSFEGAILLYVLVDLTAFRGGVQFAIVFALRVASTLGLAIAVNLRTVTKV